VLDSMVDAVGIEPTTCRLRARILRCSAVLDIALSCLFLGCYSKRSDEAECRDYPVLPAFFKHVPYKSPYSVLSVFPPEGSRLGKQEAS
jgi:hypothetical protein